MRDEIPTRGYPVRRGWAGSLHSHLIGTLRRSLRGSAAPQASRLLRLLNENRALIQGTGLAVRDGVYGHAVLIWLMILKRISDTGTLTDAVETVRAGSYGDLLSVRGSATSTRH